MNWKQNEGWRRLDGAALQRAWAQRPGERSEDVLVRYSEWDARLTLSSWRQFEEWRAAERRRRLVRVVVPLTLFVVAAVVAFFVWRLS